jgi:hypothetical protein
MSNTKADEFRREAQDCLLRAEKSRYEVSKASWLKVAEKWQRLAERMESCRFSSQAGSEAAILPHDHEGAAIASRRRARGNSDNRGIMASKTNNMEGEVRRRAYELWEQYGRPDGGEEEFWLKAEREITKAKGLNRTVPESSKTASGSNPQEKVPPGSRQGE